MKKYFFLIIPILFTGLNCSQSFNKNEITHKAWCSNILVDHSTNEFTPNVVLYLGDSIASIHQFGTGEKLFELPYKIEGKELFLDNKTVPFMKILKVSENELMTSLHPSDTTIYKHIKTAKLSKEDFLNKVLNHTFTLKSTKSNSQKIIFFDKKEVFFFSADILKNNSTSQSLLFERIPYRVDFTKNILTIMIGDRTSPKIQYSPEGSLELLNLIIGKINFKDNNSFEIKEFSPTGTSELILTPIQRNTEPTSLEFGVWKWGGLDKMVLKFRTSKDLEITENKEKKHLTWKTDDTGQLIIIKEKSGEKLFAIKDFQKNKKRINVEISKGRFVSFINMNK